MNTFFATFGVGHAYSGCYVEIVAESHHAARAFMIKNHGDQWSSEIYDRLQFTAPGKYLERFKPRKLATVRQKPDDKNKDGTLIFIADNRRNL